MLTFVFKRTVPRVPSIYFENLPEYPNEIIVPESNEVVKFNMIEFWLGWFLGSLYGNDSSKKK